MDGGECICLGSWGCEKSNRIGPCLGVLSVHQSQDTRCRHRMQTRSVDRTVSLISILGLPRYRKRLRRVTYCPARDNARLVSCYSNLLLHLVMMNDAVLMERGAMQHVKPTCLVNIQEGTAPTTELPLRALVIRKSSGKRDMTQF